jgi:hypothetical protein
VAEDVASTVSGQIEVGMLRQVQDRVGIRNSFVIDAQFALLAQAVCDLDRQIARVTFLSVWACIGKFQGACRRRAALPRFPQNLVETLHPAVGMVTPIVTGQYISFSI